MQQANPRHVNINTIEPPSMPMMMYNVLDEIPLCVPVNDTNKQGENERWFTVDFDLSIS